MRVFSFFKKAIANFDTIILVKTNLHKINEHWDEVLKKASYAQMNIPNSNKTENKKALDICCGNGDLLLRLCEEGYMVYGVDFSEHGIKSARDKVKDATLYKLDMNDIDSFDKSINECFDLIVLQNSLAFLDNKTKLCKAITSKLNPDGLFIISSFVLIDGVGVPSISITKKEMEDIESAFKGKCEKHLNKRSTKKGEMYRLILKIKK